MLRCSIDGFERMLAMMRWKLAVLLGIPLLVAGGIVFSAHRSVSQAEGGVTLKSVSSQILAANDIYLDAPSTSAAISRTTAESVALNVAAHQLAGARVLDAQLAQVRTSTLVTLNGRTLWVVALTSGDGLVSDHALGEPTRTLALNFALVFVDPETGQFVESTRNAGPVAPGGVQTATRGAPWWQVDGSHR
jgi:hypothetical protein